MSDVRDEALGAKLQQEANRIESVPVDRLPDVLRRGGRLRAIRFTAIGAALAVFAGAVSLAGLSLRNETIESEVTLRYSSRAAPWTFNYPSGWTTKTISRVGPELRTNVLRTTVVNGPMPSLADDFGPNSVGNDALTSEAGDAGAIVLVVRFWGGKPSTDDYPHLGPGAFGADAESPGWTIRERTRCDGSLCFVIVEWLGPSVSDEDRDVAAEIARSVRLADVDRWTESDGVSTTLHDEARRYVVTYPTTWVVADENLTPWLSSPSEILSLGTFPLRASAHPDDGFRLFDAPVAPAALQDMRSEDAFLSLQDSGGVFAGSTESRPDHFGPLGCDESIYGCRPSQELPEAWRDAPFRAWWIPFEDAGRAFHLFVAIGTEATPELRQQTWAVADSLSFEPASA
ncbi:MAG TPA: hypothetical protein VF195_12810 [Actinomycetota bacterium]